VTWFSTATGREVILVGEEFLYALWRDVVLDLG